VFKSDITREVFYIVFISVSISLIVNAFHPGGLDIMSPYSPEHNEITPESDMKAGPVPIRIDKAAGFHSDPSVLFVDARSQADYNACHIQNAINLPEHSFEKHLDEFMNTTDMDKSIITYCSSLDCPLARHLAEKLFFLGFENIYYLIGGLDAWQDKGLPVESVQEP